MAEEKVLKGVYREGDVVASVVQGEENARIMLKGVEPALPKDPGFKEALQKVVAGCKEHVEKFPNRELCAVLLQRPALAEHVDFTLEDFSSLGLTRVSVLDGNCGIAVRVCENEPPPTPLAYNSLSSGGDMACQPGLADIPSSCPRKTYKDLTDAQRKVFEVAAQVAGRGLVRFVCIEDGTLKLVASVKDMPPPRARSILVPLGALADRLARGDSLDEIGKSLLPLRS